MFYFSRISPFGCLLWTILLVWLFFKLKLYYVIFFIIILAFAYNLYVHIKGKIKVLKENKDKSYEPEIGEVYKICPFCNKDIKRNATICPHCRNKID